MFKGQPVSFLRLKGPRIEKIEKVGEEDCYVLSGASEISEKETLWVSKTSYLIRKYYRSVKPPEGALEKLFKSTGQEETKEGKKLMREFGKIIETTNGSFTELYEKVSSPELNKDDFKFALPEGTVLEDSPFDEMFDGNKDVSK